MPKFSKTTKGPDGKPKTRVIETSHPATQVELLASGYTKVTTLATAATPKDVAETPGQEAAQPPADAKTPTPIPAPTPTPTRARGAKPDKK
ncbi:hypothetical protein [Nesterenkonia rhizosphaerae]|uniref:Uncharacterized protein n=1 Tax=Nesterenkonia rhizosphaerae TaxID=1348272 RepID=A0ABP9FZB2_9MICC